MTTTNSLNIIRLSSFAAQSLVGNATGSAAPVAAIAFSTFLQSANNLSDLVSASTARTNLGLGTAAVKAASDGTKSTLASISGTIVAGHVATFADTSGTVQDGGALGALAYVASTTLTGDVTGSGTSSIASTISSGAVTLAKLAALAATSLIGNSTGGSATPTAVPFSTFLQSANNLSDLTNMATARANLGVASANDLRNAFLLGGM